MLQIKNIQLQIAGVEKPILKEINYEVQAGDFVVILGSNGSGKSSLLKVIAGHLKATQGSILLDGKNSNAYSKKEYSAFVKTVTQNCDESLFTSLTVFENYRLMEGSKLTSISAARHFLEQYLAPFNINLSVKLDQVVSELSGGEKQALVLAFVFLHPPKLLLLDEHTSALDPKIGTELMELTQTLLKKHQITCMLTTHDLKTACEYGNRILVLKAGMIISTIEKDKQTALDEAFLLKTCY